MDLMGDFYSFELSTQWVWSYTTDHIILFPHKTFLQSASLKNNMGNSSITHWVLSDPNEGWMTSTEMAVAAAAAVPDAAVSLAPTTLLLSRA